MSVRPHRAWVSSLAACLAATACSNGAGAPVPRGAAVTVTSQQAEPYTFADGAPAKRQADAQCGARGVRTSIYDRFVPATAAWVFVRGCA
jgi:hypothetical protein